MPLFDAHMHSCHDHEFSPSGEDRYLSCASKPEDWTILNNEKHPSFRIFAGVHPMEIPEDLSLRTLILEELAGLISRQKNWGIGECGLDRRFYKKIPRALQLSILKEQFHLARLYERPLTLHQVHAPGVLAELLEQEKLPVPFIIHGFKGKIETARRFLKQGAYLSLGPGPQWEKQDFQEMVQALPREKLLLESDWPYATGPYPTLMETLYGNASRTLGVDREALEELIIRNGEVFTN